MSTNNYAGCFKMSFTTLKAYINFSEDMYSVLNCRNVAKHTEFYLRSLRFNVTSTGNAKCFKNRFTTLKVYINVFTGHVQCFELS
jgi:hypothetical protein